jgi:hypothetical protein
VSVGVEFDNVYILLVVLYWCLEAKLVNCLLV